MTEIERLIKILNWKIDTERQSIQAGVDREIESAARLAYIEGLSDALQFAETVKAASD